MITEIGPKGRKNINKVLPNKTTNIRFPNLFKKKMQLFVAAFNHKTGTKLTMSEFVTTASEYYIKYLLEAAEGKKLPNQEIIRVMKEFTKEVEDLRKLEEEEDSLTKTIPF